MVGSVWKAALGACCFGAAAAAVAGGLPPQVEQALQRAHVPSEALVAVVQDTGSDTQRLAWQAERPVNPASLTKLVTTYAALDILGPSWTWNTPVWLHGTLRHPGPTACSMATS